MKKKLFVCLLVVAGLITSVSQQCQAEISQLPNQKNAGELTTKVLDKSKSGNPMLGFDENGNILYGGDPSILVDGDTIYCYVGHDTSTGEGYKMPDWRCYSSKDMVNWTYESMIMSGADISWAANKNECWAAQVMKGSNGKYYFYYCTEANSTYGSGKSIGVAVSDSPTGPFTDIGQPLVRDKDTGSITGSSVASTWEDIDPTAWIETDANGEEHIYLGWGNVRFFNCELENDPTSPGFMTTIKDRDGDGEASIYNYSVGFGDQYDIAVGIINNMPKGHQYTEAPYYYRQQDENGNYFGKYYMFFAYDWREQMAYATTDDITSNEWEFGGLLMEPSATANTNHMAVFDFKGQTYFVYHDGALPNGSGFRRVACVEPITINADGTIDYIKKTAVGLRGTASVIRDNNGKYLTHVSFTNTLADTDYPILGKKVYANFAADANSIEWEIKQALTDLVTGTKTDEYVSIESNDKPGLHLAVEENAGEKNVVISHYWTGDIESVIKSGKMDTADLQAKQMTFKTYEGLNGDANGVSFESVAYPGYFLVSNKSGVVFVTDTPDADAATFYIGDTSAKQPKGSKAVYKTKRMYAVGDILKVDDIRIQLYLNDESVVRITDYTTNVKSVDMKTAGTKELKVSYYFCGKKVTETVPIVVLDKEYFK